MEAVAAPDLPTGLWAEMRGMPRLDRAALPEPTLDVSLLIPARGAAHSLEDTVRQAHSFLKKAFGESFEIILIPNPPLKPKPGAAPDQSTEVARELAARFDHVVVRPHLYPQGKGAALRTGFAGSRGALIFFTDADLPYKLDFFVQASHALKSGFDFVTGNRRLGSSVFDIPVGLLKLAYRRHRLGLAFNRAVQWLMPLRTTDTQAGLKAMSRRLATEAFSRQQCPGFFFDLEIFLTARAQGLKHTELPVTLFLNTEKSTVRVLRESWLAAFWLARIALRDRFKRAYGPHRPEGGGPVARFGKNARLSLGTRLFLEARWRLTPYSVMAAKLPPRGKILDLGCGHGLFSLALALGSPGREVIGLDHDAARIELARQAARGIGNLRFASGTLSDPEQTGAASPDGSADGISIIDVMHYFPRPEQDRLFRQAFDLLAPGGTLIVREVDPGQGFVSSLNRFYEKVATSTGFTRSEEKQQLHFRSRDEWEEALRECGFEVLSEPCSHPLFADILYVCHKPVGENA